ncbi:MAG: hypothetical protein IJV75_00315 [Alphaproteobacteria bacterium]|nr:hypothetical protein [Alphaproteobacteria bacterium]
MKLNKQKIKKLELFGVDTVVKDEESFIDCINRSITSIARGQSFHKDVNILGEQWGLENLQKLIDCIDYKRDVK